MRALSGDRGGDRPGGLLGRDSSGRRHRLSAARPYDPIWRCTVIRTPNGGER